MKLYRFSPIENKEQLIEAIKYTHFTAFELCKKALGKYLPTAGNIGIFCHYQKEFEFLEKLRKELTDSNDSFNGKYFRLLEPIVIAAKDDIPGTTYEYLYIRQPDRFRPQVGDADFVIDEKEFNEIKMLKELNSVKLFDRSDLGACELFNPDCDVLPYLTTRSVKEALANQKPITKERPMDNNPEKIINNLVVELHIPDFAKAIEFYSLFGFTKLMYDSTSGGGSDLGYMVLIRKDIIGYSSINFYGDKEIVSQHAHFKDFPSDTPRGYEVEITIPMSKVQDLWDQIKDKLNAEQIAQPLTLKRWGKSDFRVVDPFGFYIRFTELVDWGQE